MTEDQPANPGVGPPAPTNPASSAPRSRIWPAIALGAIVLAVVATVVAVVALNAATTRSPASSTTATATTPTHTPAEVSAAQRQLCDTYQLAAKAVQVDTNGTDKALARIATTNSAVMLENAAASPALDNKYRDAARTLAAAYLNATAMSTTDVANDAQWQAAIDDVIAKDGVMKKLCGGG